MWENYKQHWRFWPGYAEVLKEAKDLASWTGCEVTFRPWDGGWVIFNLRNLWDLRCERRADEVESEERHRDAVDSSQGSYSEVDYEHEQLRLEADDYLNNIADYN